MPKRGFGYYWDLIETPVTIFAVFSLITMIVPIENWIGQLFSTILSILIMVFSFGLVGYNVSKEKDAPYGKTGAYAGLVIGLISAIVAILTFYVFPARFAEAIQGAVQAGASAMTTELFIKIGLFAGIVINPAIYAGIVALLTWISRFIFKRKK